jgi:hypothetical protein
MKKIIVFIIMLDFFLVAHASECRNQIFADTGLKIWKLHLCDQNELNSFTEKLKKCPKKVSTEFNEELFVMNFTNRLLKEKLNSTELSKLQIIELDQNSSPHKKSSENLNSCLRKLSVFFSFKVKDILIAETFKLAEENTISQCQNLIKSLDEIFSPLLKEKLKNCSALGKFNEKEVQNNFCNRFKEGCFFLQK